MDETTRALEMLGMEDQEPLLRADESGQITMSEMQREERGGSKSPKDRRKIPAPERPDSFEDEVIDIDDYEMVGPEFFAQIKEPAFTVNVTKTTPNAASVRLLPHAEYVKYLIHRKQQRLVLMPCDETDIRGYRWAKEKNGRRYATDRTGRIFVLHICRAMGWDPDYRYKVRGRKSVARGEEVLVFDLSRPMSYETSASRGKKPDPMDQHVLTGWNGSFGPKYGEEKGTLEIDTYDGYTIVYENDRTGNGKNREITEVPVTPDGDPIDPVAERPGDNTSDNTAQNTGDDTVTNVPASLAEDARMTPPAAPLEQSSALIPDNNPELKEPFVPASSPGFSSHEETQS